MELLKDSLIYSGICIVIFIAFGIYTNIIRKAANRLYCNSFGIMGSVFIDTKLTFIGVIHHELSHLLFALISGAKITSVSLFKFNSKDGTLGNVKIRPRGNFILKGIQIGLSAIGPIVLGAITSLYLTNLMLTKFNHKNIVFWMLAVLILQITYHMNMSKADIKAAIKGLPIILIIIISIIYALLYNSVDIISVFNSLKNSLIIIVGLCMLNLIIALVISGIKFICKGSN